MFAARNALLLGAPPVLYDSVGAGNTAAIASAGTMTWTQILGPADALVAIVGTYIQTSSFNVTCKVGSTSMPILKQDLNFFNNAGFYMSITAFVILAPPTGSQTITITNSSGALSYTGGNSTAYRNVASFGTGSTQTGTGASLSHSISSLPGQMVVQGAAAITTSASVAGSFSSYNQTSRSNIAGVSGVNAPFVMGDAPGASSVAFTAAVPLSSPTWGSVIVPLLPA